MIRWTSFASWESVFPFSGSLTSMYWISLPRSGQRRQRPYIFLVQLSSIAKKCLEFQPQFWSKAASTPTVLSRPTPGCCRAEPSLAPMRATMAQKFQVSIFGVRASHFGFRASGFFGFELLVSCFVFRVSGFKLRISGFESRGLCESTSWAEFPENSHLEKRAAPSSP